MSKFDKIFEAREPEKPTSEPKNNPKTKTGNASPNKKIKVEKPSPVQPLQDNERKRGRPPAKRSDPDYVGFTTYIRKNTHLKVKISLLQEGKGRELSELVETLLSDWANKQ